jgi:ATP-dependent protease ClpP protease subunit
MNRHVQALTGYKERLFNRVASLNPGLATEIRNMRLPWYTIVNQDSSDVGSDDETSETDESQILIYDEIGGSFGISAEEFVNDLNGITSKEISVRINSPGGSVFDAIAIYNALVAHPANITTYVDALAASAASIIALAGDKTVMMLGSQMMIHDALGQELGNAADMRIMAKFLDQQSDNIASMYAARAGGTIADWRATMIAERWYMANEAVEAGLANEVYKPKPKESDATEDQSDVEADDSTEEPVEATADTSVNIEALMRYRHNLTNRGFKYAGRRRAPSPNATGNKLTAVSGYLSKIGAK